MRNMDMGARVDVGVDVGVDVVWMRVHTSMWVWM